MVLMYGFYLEFAVSECKKSVAKYYTFSIKRFGFIFIYLNFALELYIRNGN